MKKTSLLHHTRVLAPSVFGAAASVLLVAVVTWAATTINDNVNTGGTLTVSGAATLSSSAAVTGAATFASTVNASSTLQVDGRSLFYGVLSAGAATNSPTTTFNVTGSGYFTGGLGVGYATTGAGTLLVKDLIVSQGRVGVNATTSPYQEFGVTGDGVFGGAIGTSTVSLESSTSARGGCIELRDADGRWISIYPGRGGATTTTAHIISAANLEGASGNTALLIVEVGRCEAGTD